MTLVLNKGEYEIDVKTYGIGGLKEIVFFDKKEIPFKDFLAKVLDVLTGNNLGSNDARLEFIERIKSIQQTKGYNKGSRRLIVTRKSCLHCGQNENNDQKTILFEGYKISLTDLLDATSYVLTNTDLEPGDPRLAFIRQVKSMKPASGSTFGTLRLKPS